MIPNRNQTDTGQTDQRNSEPGSDQRTSYRPDWIIPDNGLNDANRNRPGNQQENQSDHNTDIPMDNDETLGIP